VAPATAPNLCRNTSSQSTDESSISHLLAFSQQPPDATQEFNRFIIFFGVLSALSTFMEVFFGFPKHGLEPR
jgi:hypothetical protein